MTGTITYDVGGVRWSLRPDLFERREELFGSDGLRLPEWLASGAANIIKQASHRSIYRVVLPGLDCHVKRYPAQGLRAWVQHFVRPTRARVEFDRALGLEARQVPAVEALAIGEPRRGFGSSYLLTRTVPQSLPLSDFLETEMPSLAPPLQTTLRQRLAHALGSLLARMHDAGAVHHDLHPANILLRRLPGDELLFCLVDLLAVRFGPPLGADARFRNLVVFNRWFSLRSERTDRLRFWHAYQTASRPTAARGITCEPRPLERATLASNARFWLGADRRCLGDNRYFRRVKQGELSGHAVADLEPELLAALLADPDALFSRPDVRRLKDSPSSSVVELALSDGRKVIVKRFPVTRQSDPWASLFRPSPALRSFVMGHSLRLRGLPTPRPLAVLHRRRLGLVHEGYLVTESVPEARDLATVVRELVRLSTPENRRALRALIDRVARLLRELHERQMSHRDLKAPNLLVSRAGWSLARTAKVWLADGTTTDENAAATWLIDLAGVRRHRRLSRARRVQNIARLHASFVSLPGLTRCDKLRFLRIYLAWGLHGKTGWKQWWRDIEKMTQAKVEANRRKGRVLG